MQDFFLRPIKNRSRWSGSLAIYPLQAPGPGGLQKGLGQLVHLLPGVLWAEGYPQHPVPHPLGQVHGGIDMAGLPRWQAEPEETQKPRSLSQRTTTWLGYPGREMAQMWGASPGETTARPGTPRWKVSRA